MKPTAMGRSIPKVLLILLLGQMCSVWCHKHFEKIAGDNCTIQKLEYTVPYVADIRGQLLTYNLPSKGPDSVLEVTLDGVPTEVSENLPDHFNVAFRWRKENHILVLRKISLVAEDFYMEWKENTTDVREFTYPQCSYQGYIAGMESSYAAITACDGLKGFMRTNDEDVYIEPVNSESHVGKKGRPHFIYSCKESHHQKKAVDINDEGIQNTHIKRSRHYKMKTQRQHHLRQHRVRRDIPVNFYLEVLLATDNTLVKFHGKSHLEQYLLGIINIMNAVYQHGSLGMKIEVVLKRIVVLEERETRDIISEGNAQATLDRFCQWSTKKYHENRGTDTSYDLAIFITKRNIGPAGYAPVTGMCRPHRSCSINKDDGLTSAFIVSHEAAHVFGVQHDGQGNHCYGTKYHGSIMAPMVESTFGTYYWSDCSAARMRYFAYHLSCLRNNPKRRTWPSMATPIGVGWTLDAQCKQEFGEGFRVCGGFRQLDPCTRLWCSHQSTMHMCRTKNGPPLEGSKCGFGQWCLGGACQYKSNLIPIDGAWGSWTSWGPCSVTCGFGARFRQRKCNNPSPAFNGKECEGRVEEFKICKTDVCVNNRDMRAEQCALFDGYVIGNNQHTWRPTQLGNGRKLMKYHRIIVLPKGARNIFISESPSRNNFMALEDEKADEFPLNGDGIQATSHSFILKGARFVYTNTETEETLQTTGPINGFLIALLYMTENNTDSEITYSYTASRDDYTFEKNSFKWRFDKWSECSVSCGAGTQNTMYNCYNTLTDKLVDKNFCLHLENPRIDKVECTREECMKSRWVVERWSSCSKTCGSDGVEKPVYFCVSDSRKKDEVISDSYCDKSKEPNGTRECNRVPCAGEWQIGEWTKLKSLFA
ncbi:A disintegrin and metalloproteinase with thrombospondin motifs 3-like [Octopus bimaculoides]|uniref:A disintegrin and metalloproteinase with thrombospondin motifs 3-like n=1 Tax=Octopus bimaculoides TaxID=37653 RepID=UPI0022E59F73|nr:A disintegrin and metalloproteinase with thrombospondin motifs 3-like [Octopus bimaculoides]